MTGFYIDEERWMSSALYSTTYTRQFRNPQPIQILWRAVAAQLWGKTNTSKGRKDIFAYMGQMSLKCHTICKMRKSTNIESQCWRLSLHKSEEAGSLHITDKTGFQFILLVTIPTQCNQMVPDREQEPWSGFAVCMLRSWQAAVTWKAVTWLQNHTEPSTLSST